VWLLIAAATTAVGAALGAAGLPSPYLFAALLCGLALALRAPGAATVPEIAGRAAQAIAGVSLGTALQSDALGALADSLLPVALACGATLALSLAAGALLARTTALDERTAALGMIAGGATGIVAMSGELGADDRLVAFMQYLRVLLVVVITPLLAGVVFGAGGDGAAVVAAPLLGDARDGLLAGALAVAGALAAERARITAGVLLGPMVLTGVLVLVVPGGAFAVPSLLQEAAFAVIGLQVGLRFTVAAVRLLGRLLMPVTAMILALLAASFALGVALDATTSASLLDAYLATTPGGLYAVLAVAYGAGANATFVVAVQSLRLFVMILLAPLAVRWIVRRG
jgi:membrane AbrB-like protein